MDVSALGNTFFFQWEVDLMEWFQHLLNGGFGTTLTKVFTFIGGEKFSLIMLLIIYFCYKKTVARRVSIPLMASTLWFPMIKCVVLRLRPYMVHPDRVQMWELPEADAHPMDVVQQGYSMPSGHSAMSLALYGSLAAEVKKRWMWCVAIILPLLVGICRFIVGVHYPTDVLAGWGIGLLALAFGAAMQKYVPKEWVRFAILGLVTIPGIFWCTSRDYFSGLGALLGLFAALAFEQKFVKFEDTRKWLFMVLRILGACVIYFGLDKLMKMPFSTEFLNSGSLSANLVRTARYMVTVFVIMGVYPMCFRLFHRGENTQTAAKA